MTELGAQFPVFLAEEEINGVAGIAAMEPSGLTTATQPAEGSKRTPGRAITPAPAASSRLASIGGNGVRSKQLTETMDSNEMVMGPNV